MKDLIYIQKLTFAAAFLLGGFALYGAALDVVVDKPNVTETKAVVRLEIANHLGQMVESVRASAFLIDPGGKMVAQASRWIVGGNGTGGLDPGKTNIYHFVISAGRNLPTNITAKITVGRLVLEGGQPGEVGKDVVVSQR